MSIIIVNHKGRATRGPGLHLVDSQKTERHQAVHYQAVWHTPRATFFGSLTPREVTVLWRVVAVAACAAVGWAIGMNL